MISDTASSPTVQWEGLQVCSRGEGRGRYGSSRTQQGVIAESVPKRTLRLRHDPAVGFHGRGLSGRARFRGQPWWATVRPQPVIERLRAFPVGGKAVPDGCLWQRSEIRPAKVCTVSGTHLAGNTSASMANKPRLPNRSRTGSGRCEIRAPCSPMSLSVHFGTDSAMTPVSQRSG